MLRKGICFWCLILSVLILYACHNNSKQDDMLVSLTGKNASDTAGLSIQEEKYLKDGIRANYPVIISGTPNQNMTVLNQLIEKDFNKILQIYSFNPFPEASPSPGSPVILLNIDDNIKLNNGRLFSILYKASYNSPYTAYPTELVYTTNIDVASEKRLKLSDVIKITPEFVKNFKTWDFISPEKQNKEVNDAIKEYIRNQSEEDLLQGFKKADIIGSENLWGIYSYLTPDSLGISLSVPNYLGDHIEFEKKYVELKDYLIKP